MSSLLHQAIKQGALRDGVTPYSNVEPIAAAKQVLTGQYVFPYVGVLPVWQHDTLQWAPDFGANHASKALWFYSLVFIDYLVKAAVVEQDEQCWQKAQQLYQSYQLWRENDANATSILFKDEHAVTNRSCVLSQLLHVVERRVKSEPELQLLQQKLLSELVEHANWLAQDQHYVFNNHGVMMDRALLNLVVQFRQHNLKLHEQQSEQWLTKALSRIQVMLNKTFDVNGCCTENSPSYHMLNLSLFGAINAFIQKYHLIEADNAITIVLKKAIAAAALQIHEDGSLLLVGDSEAKASVFVPDSYHKGIFGEGFYPDSGFCLIKWPGFYFSFKCGGSSFSHRHIDDTSITLRVSGLDFICDGGMYSYDFADPVRKFLVSHHGHSGFFTEECANVRFANYSATEDLARICWVKSDDGLIQFEGESQLDSSAIIKRKVSLLGTKEKGVSEILLSDSLRASTSKKWRQQFLLHPDVELEIRNNQAVLTRENIRLVISVNTSALFTLTIEDGFHSEKYQSYKSCKVLVVVGEAQGADITTLITLGYV